MNKNSKINSRLCIDSVFPLFTYFLAFADYLHADNLLSIIKYPFEYEKSKKNDLLRFF